MNSSIYNKLIIEYERFVKTLIFYNEYHYGGLFSNLSDDKIEEKALGTFENIYNYSLKSYDVNCVKNIYNFIIKIVRYFNKKEDIAYLFERIYKIFLIYNKNSITFYEIFSFFADCVKILKDTGNILFLFLKNISDYDFSKINEQILLDSIVFIQCLLKIFFSVLELYWKKKKVSKSIM